MDSRSSNPQGWTFKGGNSQRLSNARIKNAILKLMRKQKGFAPIIVLVGIIVLITVAGSAYYLGTKKVPVPSPAVISQAPTPSISSSLVTSPSSTSSPSLTPTISEQLAKISIASLSPSSGVVGTQVTITGSGFTKTNNSIAFFDPIASHHIDGTPGNVIENNASSPDGKTLIFTVPSGGISGILCDDSDNKHCMGIAAINLAQRGGSYPVSVKNSNGESNILMFTIIPNFKSSQ